MVSLDPSRDVEAHRKVTIPGYPNLREFSKHQEKLLQEECGVRTDQIVELHRETNELMAIFVTIVSRSRGKA